MADIIDLANDRSDADTGRAIAAARADAARIEQGKAGECDFCGEWTGRLVGGACAPCRDQRGLP